MAQPAKFCLSNRKGGVGKTTCSIHIAGALNERGHEVLLFDLDPQGTATRGLGYDEYYSDIDRETTLDEVLLEFDGRERINQLIREHSEFDLVPSHKKMTYDVGSKLDGEPRGEDRLELALDELDRAYDFIVIDCPPSLDLLTDNALLATKNVLIPTYPEELSVQGLDLLFDQVEELERWHEVEIRELGLVANRIENNNEADEYLDLFHDSFGEMWHVWEVRKRVALQRSIAQGECSIFGADEDCDMQDVFTDIACTLEQKLAQPPEAEVIE